MYTTYQTATETTITTTNSSHLTLARNLTNNNNKMKTILGLTNQNSTTTTAAIYGPDFQLASNFSLRENNVLQDHIETISRLSDTGYLLSLIALLLAMFIFTCIKRLKCPKNILHLQLFVSFIIRCASNQLINLLFSKELMLIEDERFLWVCKAITVVWEYSLLANYNWILMEGVYLHSLIFHAAMSTYGPAIIGYIVFGWAMPLINIIPWIFVKSKYEDEACWLLNNNQSYFWILRGPITFSILLNFIIYIRIVAVLYSKIFSGSMVLQASKKNTELKYRKLLRSTLVLIPLFGVHYAALLLFQQYIEINEHKVAEVVWMYIETVFTSCQGFIVACLYCFLNGEVHQEVKRLWRSSE